MEIQRWKQPHPPDSATLQKMMEADGYNVIEWADPAGKRYDTHTHHTDQSHWIISGELELTVKGETYQLRPGDRDFLPAMTAHSAYVPGDEPVRYLIGVKNS